MVPGLQAKLLRFLEEKTFKRVGGSADIQRRRARRSPRPTASSRRKSKQGRFREDLYYRLNVLPIALPPLRDRRRRHPAAGRLLRRRLQPEFKKRVRGVDAGRDEARCRRYGWPGNIRELRNAVERAMLLVEGDELTADDFPVGGAAAVRLGERVELPAEGIDLEQLERSLVVQALERSRLEPDAGRRRCSA